MLLSDDKPNCEPENYLKFSYFFFSEYLKTAASIAHTFLQRYKLCTEIFDKFKLKQVKNVFSVSAFFRCLIEKVYSRSILDKIWYLHPDIVLSVCTFLVYVIQRTYHTPWWYNPSIFIGTVNQLKGNFPDFLLAMI